MSMDSGSWTLYIFLLLLILGGGYFAAAETAFASVSRVRIRTGAEKGEKRAQHALHVIEHFDRAITTLLICTNIVYVWSSRRFLKKKNNHLQFLSIYGQRQLFCRLNPQPSRVTEGPWI